MPGSIVIVGAGPNLGFAVARRFGRQGFKVGLISRTQSKLDDLAAQLEGEGIHVAHTAIAGSIAPGGDNEPEDIADVLWSHHIDRATFQMRIGI